MSLGRLQWVVELFNGGLILLVVQDQPDGAFYVWADASPLFARLGVRDSSELVELLMRRAHLVVTPSRDFCADDPGTHLRFSTASSMAQLREAVERLRALLA